MSLEIVWQSFFVRNFLEHRFYGLNGFFPIVHGFLCRLLGICKNEGLVLNLGFRIWSA